MHVSACLGAVLCSFFMTSAASPLLSFNSSGVPIIGSSASLMVIFPGLLRLPNTGGAGSSYSGSIGTSSSSYRSATNDGKNATGALNPANVATTTQPPPVTESLAQVLENLALQSRVTPPVPQQPPQPQQPQQPPQPQQPHRTLYDNVTKDDVAAAVLRQFMPNETMAGGSNSHASTPLCYDLDSVAPQANLSSPNRTVLQIRVYSTSYSLNKTERVYLVVYIDLRNQSVDTESPVSVQDGGTTESASTTTERVTTAGPPPASESLKTSEEGITVKLYRNTRRKLKNLDEITLTSPFHGYVPLDLTKAIRLWRDTPSKNYGLSISLSGPALVGRPILAAEPSCSQHDVTTGNPLTHPSFMMQTTRR